MYEYRIYGDEGHLHWMSILLERSRIPYHDNWVNALQEQYMWEEANNNEIEDDNGPNNVQNNQDDPPEINNNAEWDDGWDGHPIEVHPTSGFISRLINLLKSIKLYFTCLLVKNE